MSHPTYSAVIYIQDDSNFSLSHAMDCFRSSGPLRADRVEGAGEKEMQLFFTGWRLRVALEDEPYVVEENQTIAQIPGYPYAEDVARCKRCLYVWSMEPDPEMDHFNDWLITVEILLHTFHGLLAVDEASNEALT